MALYRKNVMSKKTKIESLELEDAGFVTELADGRQRVVPIVVGDDEPQEEVEIPEILPILTLRSSVLFPGAITPITVGRDNNGLINAAAYTADYNGSAGTALFGTGAAGDKIIMDQLGQEFATDDSGVYVAVVGAVSSGTGKLSTVVSQATDYAKDDTTYLGVTFRNAVENAKTLGTNTVTFMS